MTSHSLLGILLIFLVSCQTAPTKIYETQSLNIRPLVEGAKNPIVLDDNTVIIDARGAFEYTLAHFPKSIHLNWQEFVERGSGVFKEDKFFMARRLARLGINQDSKVVVVGQGPFGQGEEGRLAWTLLYLGVKDVQFAGIKYFRKNMTNTETRPLGVKPIWKPKPIDSVLVKKRTVLQAIVNDEGVHVIDVRSQKEYFARSGDFYNSPNIKAINIEWKEFLTPGGRPNLNLVPKLKAVGIRPKDRVIVISNQGTRSGAVTMALLSMGYRNAANYAGGLKDLLDKKK